MVDQEALARVKGQGARLEVDGGGRHLGALVHRALALLAPVPPELEPAEEVTRYVARQFRATERLTERAVAMVQRGVGGWAEGKRAPARAWAEVPFAVVDGDEVTEGAIDLLVDTAAGGVVAVDYKTDRIAPHLRDQLDPLYALQLGRYVSAVGKAGKDAEGHIRALAAP